MNKHNFSGQKSRKISQAKLEEIAIRVEECDGMYVHRVISHTIDCAKTSLCYYRLIFLA